MARQTTTTRRRSTARSARTASRRKRPTTRTSPSRRIPSSRAAGGKRARSAPHGVVGGTSGSGHFTRPASASETATVQRFFDGFAQALTAGDGPTAAQCFEYPALMVMAAVGDHGGSQPLQDKESVAAFFDQAPQQYHAKGIHETTAILDDLQWIAHDLAFARVSFPYLDEDGNDLGDGESSVYLLRQTQDDYAICAAVTLGAESDRAAA
jgi:hypothetical protein